MKKGSGINMTTHNKKDRLEKLPTLDQVLLVQDILQDIDDSLIPLSKLKNKLSKKLKKNTLLTILDYLETMNKIVITPKGITWIHNTNPRLQKAVNKGIYH